MVLDASQLPTVVNRRGGTLGMLQKGRGGPD